MEPFIPRRRTKRKGRHRGMSLEDMSRDHEFQLKPIHDDHKLTLDPFAVEILPEEMETESPAPHQLSNSPNMPSNTMSIDSVHFDEVFDEIESELANQYANAASHSHSPITSPLISPVPSRSRAGTGYNARGRTRSDSHFKSSAPLQVKKYNNRQLHDVIKLQRPQLLCAHELPKLDSVSDADLKTQTLLHKLKLCEVPCDFRLENVPDDESTVIENKSMLLIECEEYITKSKWSSLAVLKQIFRVVQIHLFRSLPDVCLIEEYQWSPDGSDKPPKYTLPSWMHLKSIYEMFFQLLLNSDFEKSTLEQYLSGSFLNSFVHLFHSRYKPEVFTAILFMFDFRGYITLQN